MAWQFETKVEEEELEGRRFVYGDQEKFEPTIKEYAEIVTKMKQKRSTWHDDMSIELLKEGGNQLNKLQALTYTFTNTSFLLKKRDSALF